MKNLLNKIVNSRKATRAIGLVAIGVCAVCNIVAICAIYYNGMRKGVDERDEYYYQEELRRYNNG